MKKDDSFDVVIIGGGIVGTAVGMTLSAQPGINVLLLEAEKKLARHQTGNNSGVIHSGLYYKPGSLKASNCVSGKELLYRFCEAHDVACDRCGKVVVATKPEEIPSLDELERRGRANGLQGLARIGPEQIKELEPHVTGIDGLKVPDTGIVDFKGVTRAFANEIEKNGSTVKFGARLTCVINSSDGLTLETTAGNFFAKNLINCAGLQSDRVAMMCGVNPGLRIVPFRGEYYELIPKRHELVNNLIYPVPDPRFPFLGVHFTRMIAGGIEAGPNAVLALKREGYGRFSFSAKDVFSYVSYGGFWKMALKFWKTGAGEVWRSYSKGAFVKALKRLIPEITKDDVRRASAGVRAQALLPNGKLADDFRIVEAPHMIHVLNAPSPAATASISIGASIASLAQKNFW